MDTNTIIVMVVGILLLVILIIGMTSRSQPHHKKENVSYEPSLQQVEVLRKIHEIPSPDLHLLELEKKPVEKSTRTVKNTKPVSIKTINPSFNPSLSNRYESIVPNKEIVTEKPVMLHEPSVPLSEPPPVPLSEPTPTPVPVTVPIEEPISIIIKNPENIPVDNVYDIHSNYTLFFDNTTLKNKTKPSTEFHDTYYTPHHVDIIPPTEYKPDNVTELNAIVKHGVNPTPLLSVVNSDLKTKPERTQSTLNHLSEVQPSVIPQPDVNAIITNPDSGKQVSIQPVNIYIAFTLSHQSGWTLNTYSLYPVPTDFVFISDIAFDSGKKGTDIFISDDGLSVTTQSSQLESIFTKVNVTSLKLEKFMFSATLISDITVPSSMAIGLSRDDLDINQGLGYNLSSIGFYDNGQVFTNNSFDPTPFPRYSLNGDVVDICVDAFQFTFWVRVNGGVWNQGGDPANGIGSWFGPKNH